MTNLIDREPKARAAVRDRCVAGIWGPLERDQQTLIAAVDRCDPWIRRTVLETLFGLDDGRCKKCGAVLRVVWMRTVADFDVRCERPGCESGGVPALVVEFKPFGAPAHWSAARRQDFDEALKLRLIRRTGEVPLHLPGADCGPWLCEGCLHARHHRHGGPALAQVVGAWLEYRAPVLVLSPSAIDASALYRTAEVGFTIDPGRVSTRPINQGLVDLVAALRPHWGVIGGADRARLRHMVGALWGRLELEEWAGLIRLTGRPMLPSWAPRAAPVSLAAAPALVAA